MTEKQTWACDHLKLVTPEPPILSCDIGQWIPCFKSCQLMSIIKLNVGYGTHSS